LWSDEELPEQQQTVPMEKSGVYVDPMATHVSRIQSSSSHSTFSLQTGFRSF
jgi:hypothetical protein